MGDIFIELKQENIGTKKWFDLESIITVILILYAVSASISIAASQGFLGIALILWVIKLIKNKMSGLFSSPLDLPILVFIACRIISTFTGIDTGSSMNKMKELILFLTIYIFQFNVDKKIFKRLILVLIYASAFAVVARIIHMYVIQGLPFDLEHRLNGFTGGYMTYGSILSIPILLGLSLLFFSKIEKVHKIIISVSLLFLIIGLGMTLTRSAWTGLLAALLFLGIFKNRILLVSVVLLVIIGVAFSPSRVKSRMFSMFTPKDLTTYTRLKMWNWGIKVFKDHPITGIGPNNVNKLRYTEWRKYPLEETVQDDMVHQHNNFMQMLVTLGIVGALSFLWLIFTIFKILFQSIKKLKDDPVYSGISWGVTAVFIAFIVTGLFEYNFFDSEIIMIIFMLIGGLIASLRS